MQFRLDEEFSQRSESLKKVITHLEKKANLKTSTEEGSDGKKYLLLTFPENISAQEDKEAYEQSILENTQMKLLEEFFNEKILPSPNKDFNRLKSLYANYISSSRLSKKFGTKQSLTVDLSQNKENKEHAVNILNEFATFLEEKEQRIIKVAAVLKTKENNASLSSLKDLNERLRSIKEHRQDLKGKLLIEKLKSEHYINGINEKVNTIIESLGEVSKFKETDQLKNEGIDLVYQRKLLENLKVYRELVERKILSDLYTDDQIAALRVVKEGLEKKINLLLSNKNYIEERLKEVEKKKEDEEFAEVLSKIIETNKTIRRREDQIRKMNDLEKFEK